MSDSDLIGMLDDLLEKCVTLKECIMQLAKDGSMILNLDDVVESNHISCQTRELFII